MDPRRAAALLALLSLACQPTDAPLSLIAADADIAQPVTAQPLVKALPPGVPPDFPLRFSETEWDVGRVDDTLITEHTFWMHNASSEPVRAMYNEGPDRTCIFSWRTLQPGERKPMFVRFDARTRRGEVNRMVAVQAEWGSPPRSATAKLAVHAIVLPQIFVEPVKLYVLEVPTARGADARVLVHSRQPGFRLNAVRATDQADDGSMLTFDIGPAETVDYLGEAYQRIPVTLRIPPGVPIGQYEWQLEFVARTD